MGTLLFRVMRVHLPEQSSFCISYVLWKETQRRLAENDDPSILVFLVFNQGAIQFSRSNDAVIR
jgi:hypothetical protein